MMNLSKRIENWYSLSRLGLTQESPLTHDSLIFLELKGSIIEEFIELELPYPDIKLISDNLCWMKVPTGFGYFFMVRLRYSIEFDKWVWYNDQEDEGVYHTLPILETQELAKRIAETSLEQLQIEKSRRVSRHLRHGSG
jgi:hypothetical protein